MNEEMNEEMTVTAAQRNFIDKLRAENRWMLESTVFDVDFSDLSSVDVFAVERKVKSQMAQMKRNGDARWTKARAARKLQALHDELAIAARVEWAESRSAAKKRFVEVMTCDLDGITKAAASEIINTLKGA